MEITGHHKHAQQAASTVCYGPSNHNVLHVTTHHMYHVDEIKRIVIILYIDNKLYRVTCTDMLYITYAVHLYLTV